jgi:hypothetical protein
MKIDANPTWLETLSPLALNSVTSNNERLYSGSDEPLVTPAFDVVPDSELIHFVERFLDSPKLTPKLVDIERANLSKIGPRSIAKPWSERKQSLYDYYNHPQDIIPNLSMGANGLLRLADTKSILQAQVRSSSAGLPLMVRKGKAITENLWVDIDEGITYPAVCYTRTQEGGKTRNVWGFPMLTTMNEMAYILPYIKYEKTLNHRAALLGPEAVDDAVTKLFFAKSKDEVMYCADFSSYDASVSPELIAGAFSYIGSQFQKSGQQHVQSMYEAFVTIPIFTPDGEISGLHGVPSGSGGTNSVDSQVQWDVAGRPDKCQIQGDDGLYIIKQNDVSRFESLFSSAGLTLNKEKSDIFDDHQAVYLQRYYHPSYVSSNGGLGGVYSIARALNRLKYLERWTNFDREGISGSDFFSLRAIMILENCKHHPFFRELVNYVRDLDVVGLSYSKTGLHAFSRMQESKARAGLFNQYGFAQGIGRFETTKILAGG